MKNTGRRKVDARPSAVVLLHRPFALETPNLAGPVDPTGGPVHDIPDASPAGRGPESRSSNDYTSRAAAASPA